nr:glycosyltransferase family 4 protein [Exiguobacterium sp. s193]
MKKVMILSNDHAYTYNFRKEIIKELIKNDYEVNLVLPYGEKVDLLVEMGCKFHEVKLNRRGKNIFEEIKLLLQYYKIIKKVNPSVVLTYTLKPNLYGSLISRYLKIKHINNITGLGSAFINKGWINNLLLSIYKVSLKKSNFVFCQNSSDLKFLKDNKIISDNAVLIPGSGVNLNDFKFSEMEFDESNQFNFLYIGRIMKDKGIDEYLKAAEKIKKTNKHVQFNVLGYVEPSQKEYFKILEKYSDEKVINYLGYSKNVKEIIKKSHCIIQPSHGGEGISNVLLESGAMGRILIASNIPGCKETIDNNKNGFLFEKKNDNDLSNVIEQILKKKKYELQLMGLNSHNKIKKEFDRKIVVAHYMERINKIT